MGEVVELGHIEREWSTGNIGDNVLTNGQYPRTDGSKRQVDPSAQSQDTGPGGVEDDQIEVSAGGKIDWDHENVVNGVRCDGLGCQMYGAASGGRRGSRPLAEVKHTN